MEYKWAQMLFEGREPIMWHRLPDFQQMALKAIAEQTLKHTPGYLGQASVPLYIPGELLQQKLTAAEFDSLRSYLGNAVRSFSLIPVRARHRDRAWCLWMH